jgi:transposase InsO family protein
VRGREPSKHATDDEALTKEIEKSHIESRRTYGSPRIHADLKLAGRRTSRKRIIRLMGAQDIAARRKKRCRRTTDSKVEDQFLAMAASRLSTSTPDT